MVHVNGQLAGEGGLLFLTVLDHLAAPDRRAYDDTQPSLLPDHVDTRTPDTAPPTPSWR